MLGLKNTNFILKKIRIQSKLKNTNFILKKIRIQSKQSSIKTSIYRITNIFK
jgi:uncharacterized protein YehS (DUF1456 family)